MGRRTAEEEARAYLERHGINPDTLDDFKFVDNEELPDPEEMFDQFLGILYRHAKSGDLKGTGLVNAITKLANLRDEARKEREKNEVVEEREIEDILADAGLPAERRIEIGRAEVERLRERTAALEVVVARIEGEG